MIEGLALKHIDTRNWHLENSQGVPILFVRDLWEKLELPQQYESCYPIWEKFSEVTRSIRFAKEFMQETLNKECIEEIQKFYKEVVASRVS